MMQIPLTSLLPGDVLLIKYNETYWHSMMVVNGGNLAHAPGAGAQCTVEPIQAFAAETRKAHTWTEQQLKERLYAYRFNGAIPYPSWVDFAEQWCGTDANGKRTQYAPAPNEQQRNDPNWLNYPRYRGVIKIGDDGHNAAALPFGPDALLRTIKWANRYHLNAAFSVNRGTTCCAFVMACVQAAYVNASFYNSAATRLQALMTLLTDGGEVWTTGSGDRSKKMSIPPVRAPAPADSGKVRPGAALRNTSNRGLSDEFEAKFKGLVVERRKQALSEAEIAVNLWNLFETHGFVDVGWSDVGMPKAFLHDAKYMYSRTFNHVLTTDNAWSAC